MLSKLSIRLNDFLHEQIVRQDYLIIEDRYPACPSPFANVKWHRLDQLCRENGYCSPQLCDEILAQRTASQGEGSFTNSTIELVSAYLPTCIRTVAFSTPHFDKVISQQTRELQTEVAHSVCKRCVVSWEDSESCRYLLCLPADIHALLIDNSGALLAA